MTKKWAPSALGRILTKSPEWHLSLRDQELTLTVGGQSYLIDVEHESSYQLQQGVLWADFTAFPKQRNAIKVDGLPNTQAAALSYEISVILLEKRIRDDVSFVQREHQLILDWLCELDRQVKIAAGANRWFSHDMQKSIDAARKPVDLTGIRQRLGKPEVFDRLGRESILVLSNIVLWKMDRTHYWEAINREHTERELVSCKDLFERVESKPLTDEQARAVICFDNRVQVVASAGSGKTSTMVAKAAYAIHRDFVAPERIILMAFNKQAAEELKERAAKAFDRLEMSGINIEASTFHALGLSIIGHATGRKPRIPDWATHTAGGMRKLAQIIDELKDHDPGFRANWDLFRFVFKRDLPEFGAPEPADVYDAQGNSALVTIRNERVKSLEEVMIADWLFYNGVNYRYETSYEFDTADATHSQYRPDFYYPELELYHEHFALDKQGNPPEKFEGYMAGVTWKRELHRQMGTTLFETTSHGLRHADDFERLAACLTSQGAVLDPNPDREIPADGSRPMDSSELSALVRTFISHAKSNGLSVSAIRQRLEADADTTFKLRHRMFLDLAGPILEAWDTALAAEDGIDFEDMLNQAAEHLETGRYEAPYELVMADEFQDASRARARLCRALARKPHRYLFAVGDDWQSINRFAGADVAVMTSFRDWFGHGQVLKLEQTFRCPQALCDVSSAFVSKNPAQIPKRVRSKTPPKGPVLQAFQVNHRDKLTDAVDQFVMRLAEGVKNGSIPTGPNGKVSVYVLGRYNADQQHVPDRPTRFNRQLDISFLSIHRSKGSEADYVILPEMLSMPRRRSFPSTRADDPVLSLAMPDGDDYPLGEERRLFYVALTRARRSVAMFTARGYCSTFLRELEENGAVVITDIDGNAIEEEPCPACTQGVLLLRTGGPYGPFRSCSNYPICSYKPKNRQTDPAPRINQATPVTNPDAKQRTPNSAHPATPENSNNSSPATLNRMTPDLWKIITLAHAVHTATAELSDLLHAEKMAIETALKSSQQALKHGKTIAASKSVHQAASNHAYIELFDILSTDASRLGAQDLHSLPDFDRAGSHSDPEIQRSISAKVNSLRDDRDAFLSMVHTQLAAAPDLCALFKEALIQLKIEQYWAALDPHGSLAHSR